MKRIVLLLGILLVGVMLFACASKVVPVEKATALEETQITVKEAWEAEWERVTRKGREEGKVVIFTTWRPEVRKAILDAFNTKYGIVTEYILGRGNDLAEKILAERRAGLYYADLFIGGATTMMTILRPAGVFTPIEENFILPEVKDPQAWMDGRYPFLDKQGLIFYAVAFDASGDSMIYNKELVKKEEIKSWRDLLAPKFKGKIIMNDPTVAGRGQQLFAVSSEFLGLDYWREMAKQQIEFVRDQRLQVDWLAKGKYVIAIAALNEIYNEYIEAGAPVGIITSNDLTDAVVYLSTASSNTAILSNPPHPNATKTFLNWFLTKEAMTIFVRYTDWHSTRLEVPTDSIAPHRLRKPGFKYLNAETEEFLQKKLVYEEKAREIFTTR